MATLSDVLSFARTQSQTDSNGLTDANGIIFANEAIADFHRKLVNAGIDASQVQEAYKDGTANQGTYLYPTDMLFLKAIECNYVDNNQQNYKTALQVDISNLPNSSYDWLRVNADRNSPQFDDHGDWFEIFPTPQSSDNLSSLIKIFYFLKPTEYSSTGDTIAYPESLDYRLLGWRIAASYLKSQENYIGAESANVEYEKKVRDYIATLGQGSQQPLQSKPIQLTGWEF